MKSWQAMKRGYTADDYRRLVDKIRAASEIAAQASPSPPISSSASRARPKSSSSAPMTCWLSSSWTWLTWRAIHPALARSPSGACRMTSPKQEKMRRFRLLEDLQERIAAEINARYLGQTVEVLFEEKVKDRWKGRTETNKLVFVQSDRNLRGQLLPVTITWTGPWSMQAVRA